MANEIKLPALKENVDTRRGQRGQGRRRRRRWPRTRRLLEVQADKAALDVPSPTAGTRHRTARQGRRPDQGRPGHTASSKAAATARRRQGAAAAAKAVEPPPKAKPAEAAAGRSRAEPPPPSRPKPRPPPPPAPAVNRSSTPAGPATRRLARELGVDLRRLPAAAGPAASSRRTSRRSSASSPRAASRPRRHGGAPAAPPLPNFEQWGPVERAAAVGDPQGDRPADEPGLEPDPARHAARPRPTSPTWKRSASSSRTARGPKLTVTAFALKAVGRRPEAVPDVQRQPRPGRQPAGPQALLSHRRGRGHRERPAGAGAPRRGQEERVATGRGADGRGRPGQAAQARRSELKGGTFTITNLGGIGGTGFTPIVNYPEVAILGLSRSRLEPVVRGGEIVPRLMLPLSLSYDHRVIDGAAAARFTRRLAEMLENPLLMLLHA